MCISYVVWKEYKLYIISLIYLIVVIKFLGRKFLMFGKIKIFLKYIIFYLIICFRKFYDL